MNTSSFWKHTTVFITGINGFLGSHLAEELLEQGANVVGLVRDTGSYESYFFQQKINERVTIINGDLRDAELMERIFNEYEIEICFHLAAQPIVTIANRSPRSTLESNITGTWNILEAARHSTLLKGLVVASSDKAYGTSENLPYVEDQPLNAINPYDLSKSATDLLAQSYANTYDLPILISRCGNFYGPGDLNWSRIVPGAFRSFLQNEILELRSDGSPIRDYFFIKDVVSAYMALGEHVVTKKNNGEAFNFGTGEHISVLEILKKMQKITGATDDSVNILGTATHEIPAQYLDWTKAATLLQWAPKTSLEEGHEISYQWYKKMIRL